MALLVENLHVAVGDKRILNGITLSVPTGAVHALMGPNGSGKTTLAHVLMGHPGYVVQSGGVSLDGTSLLGLHVEERAKAGLFLSFQYPVEIPGVSFLHFLRTAYAALHGEGLSAKELRTRAEAAMETLGMPKEFLQRSVNEGFSGGEKKRAEIVQLAVLQPKYAILDETDSGLDVDALRTVAAGVQQLRGTMGVLVITHYSRILTHLQPDAVHVMGDGKIVRSGGADLAQTIEREGYEQYVEKA
jgi:Fe-S cluster assembly ATP-binding protein